MTGIIKFVILEGIKNTPNVGYFGGISPKSRVFCGLVSYNSITKGLIQVPNLEVLCLIGCFKSYKVGPFCRSLEMELPNNPFKLPKIHG